MPEKAQAALYATKDTEDKKAGILFSVNYAADLATAAGYNTMEGAREYIATLDKLQKAGDDFVNALSHYGIALEKYYTLAKAIYGPVHTERMKLYLARQNFERKSAENNVVIAERRHGPSPLSRIISEFSLMILDEVALHPLIH